MIPRPVEQCRVCGGELEHRPDDRGLYDPRISRCRLCGTRQLNVRVEDPTGLYPTFDQDGGRTHRFVQRMFEIFHLERQLIMRSAGIPFVKNSKKTILDVGCGNGDFLFHLDGYFEVFGQEPFSFNARKHPELAPRVFQSPIAEMPFPNASFDVITFWHSLEHMENAPAAIGRAVELMKDDGYVVLSVPNIDSFQARLFRSRWFHLVLPRHVFHFERTTLVALLMKAGLRPVYIGTLAMEYGVSGWIQSCLNAVFDPNLLYEWLKDRGEFERSRSPWKKAKVWLSLLAAGALLPVFAAVESICGIAGQGAIMNVVARKKA